MLEYTIIKVIIGLAVFSAFLRWGDGVPVIDSLTSYIDPKKFFIYSVVLTFLVKAALLSVSEMKRYNQTLYVQSPGIQGLLDKWDVSPPKISSPEP